MKKSEALLRELIEPTIRALGLELWGIEHISQGKYSLLRVYIEKEQGVSIDDCERVSRELSTLLDVEDPIKGEYTLEVSSPGLDRMLFSTGQFANYVGQTVQVKTRIPLSGRRNFKGELKDVQGATITLQIDADVFTIDHADIEKANLVFE